MAGQLFVIDGVDGSGKHTQAIELYTRFLTEGYTADEDITMVSFPRYGQPSAKFVEMYLHGELAKDAMDIDPYTTSLFYAIDRSISFKTEKWGEVYCDGGIVIADRYFTSNIIHQGAKILSNEGENDRPNKFTEFVKWLKDLELNKIKLPRPNKVFWLMTDKDTNNIMMQNRIENDTSHITDIHEENTEYLNWCRLALQQYKAYYFAHTPYIPYIQNEHFINVKDNNEIRSIGSIHNEIFMHLNK